MQACPGPCPGHTGGLRTGVVLVKVGEERPSQLGVPCTGFLPLLTLLPGSNLMYLACRFPGTLSQLLLRVCSAWAAGTSESGVRQPLFASALLRSSCVCVKQFLSL